MALMFTYHKSDTVTQIIRACLTHIMHLKLTNSRHMFWVAKYDIHLPPGNQSHINRAMS